MGRDSHFTALGETAGGDVGDGGEGERVGALNLGDGGASDGSWEGESRGINHDGIVLVVVVLGLILVHVHGSGSLFVGDFVQRKS